MKQLRIWQRGFALFGLLLLATAAAVLGQAQSGNIHGTVIDDEGQALPGVTVSLTGQGAPRDFITDANGQFRYLGLAPGDYDLKAELEGFSTLEYPGVNVRVGRSTTIELKLSPAVEDVITVTAESPLLDERKVTQGTTISQVELETIPTTRDPWAVLNQTPGVVTDRVNVGGIESGQQSVFGGPGQASAENVFAVDGVVITDMAAVGSSPSYYDFDQFTEFQITTGGTEISAATSGVTLNLVTKRGSNEARGSARFYRTNRTGLFGNFEAANPSNGAGQTAPGQSGYSQPILDDLRDWGFEAGGAFKQDVVWAWGSYGQQDIFTTASNGFPDNTKLENSAFKINAQLGSPNSLVTSFNRGDKIKDGRTASPGNQSLETTWDQTGPTEIWKLEDTHVFNSQFFLTGGYNFVDGGFGLIAKAGLGLGGGETLWDRDGIWKNGFWGGIDDRDSQDFFIDGSYFFGGATSHELKFGVKMRDFEQESNFAWPGPRTGYGLACENVGTCGAFGTGDLFIAQRAGTVNAELDYASAWVQDTFTSGRWTVNAGLRYDEQDGSNIGSSAPANPAFPNDLPQVSFNGNDGGFTFEQIVPRVGATYALGSQRDTLVRASFSQYSSQLGTAFITRLNPISAAYSTYFYDDVNGNSIFDQIAFGGALDEPVVNIGTSGVDPNNPSAANNPNVNDPGLDPELTNELLVGIEHAVVPEFVVGLDLTLRNVQDVHYLRPLVRDANGTTRPTVASDYVLETTLTSAGSNPLPDGSPWSANLYAINPNLAFTGGYLLENSDREREYRGASVNFTKRLSKRWMARGYFTYGKPEWDIPGSFLAQDDPTLAPGRGFGPAQEGLDDADNDGSVFAPESAGSAKDVNAQSTWSWNLNGMYQVAPDRPWGFNLAANLFGREGYPIPYFASFTSSIDGIQRFARATPTADAFRMDDITTMDLRIEKEFRANQSLGLIFSIDCFNCTNEDTETQREVIINGAQPNYLQDNLSPRIWRLGMRLNWR